jgi:hypothetical protein
VYFGLFIFNSNKKHPFICTLTSRPTHTVPYWGIFRVVGRAFLSAVISVRILLYQPSCLNVFTLRSSLPLRPPRFCCGAENRWWSFFDELLWCNHNRPTFFSFTPCKLIFWHGGCEIFRIRWDPPWGPPNILYNGYRVFPGGKAAGAWIEHPPYLAPRSKKEWSKTSTPPLGFRGLF